MRCARTDKGVHAGILFSLPSFIIHSLGGQVVSLKMMVSETAVEDINKYLPDQIRVWGIARVKGSFDAKLYCSSRVYEYLIVSGIRMSSH